MQARIPTFAEYAQGWWEPETCLYLKKRLARRPLSLDYVKQSLQIMRQFLVPYFGKMRLDRITDEDIDTWLVCFCDREQRRHCKIIAGDNETSLVPRKLKTSYANVCFGVLRLMLKQAAKRHIIPFNPADNVEKLVEERKRVEILTVAEFKELVKPKPKALPQEPGDGLNLWAFCLELARMANFLAACTGMRIGEVLGLRGDCVFADFIRVQGQYGQRGYGPTKTRSVRSIPLTPQIMDGLHKLVEINGNGYLFSSDGGAKPITRYYFNKYLTGALASIGIDETEKKKRNLTPHAWRYFLNTNLRAKGVPDAKVQSITGHKTQDMTDRYTQFYSEEFNEVRTIQETLLLPEGQKAKGGKDGTAQQRGNTGPVRRMAGKHKPVLVSAKR
jgi:integrase